MVIAASVCHRPLEKSQDHCTVATSFQIHAASSNVSLFLVIENVSIPLSFLAPVQSTPLKSSLEATSCLLPRPTLRPLSKHRSLVQPGHRRSYPDNPTSCRRCSN